MVLMDPVQMDYSYALVARVAGDERARLTVPFDVTVVAADLTK